MGSHKKILRYATGIDKERSEEDVTLLTFRSVKIETASVKHYSNHLHILAELSGTNRLVLDFILQEMDSNNYIANNSSFKKNFRRTIEQLGVERDYSSSTINNAFGNLKKIFVLLKESDLGRGLYRVNPLYFWKGTERSRLELIRQYREYKFKGENNKVRREYYKKMKGK